MNRGILSVVGPVRKVLLLFLAILLCSCEKDGITVTADFSFTDGIDRIYLQDESTISDGRISSVSWDASGMQINYSGDKVYLFIPDRESSSTVEVTLKVSGRGATDRVAKTVVLPGMTPYRKHGLGEINYGHSNNVGYYWYVDQGDTGPYSSINCGPACTEMAIKWSSGQTVSTRDLRNSSNSSGWWYTSDIIRYLNSNAVSNYIINFNDAESLQRELSYGKIAVLCVDIYYVRTESRSEWRIDKFYTTGRNGAGHFIIVKGCYTTVGGETFFECYDPWSIGRKYGDGQFKGMDRYYRAYDVVLAASDWWKYAIIVSPTSSPQQGKDRTPAGNLVLDPDTIPHARATISSEE